MEVGLKLTVTLLGWPVADKAMAELKPPEIVVVIVEWPEFPGLIVSDVGDALMVKLGLVPVTVRETVVVSLDAAGGSLHRDGIRAGRRG